MKHAEEIQNFIETITEELDSIIRDGGMQPHFLFLTCKDGRYGVSPFEIPPMLIDSQVGKDLLAQKILPTIKDVIKNDGQELVCVCFVSEVWKYKMGKTQPTDTTNYREECEEKVECMMWSFHLKDKSVNFYRDMLRDDKEKLVGFGEKEIMEMPYDENNSTGRFSRLF